MYKEGYHPLQLVFRQVLLAHRGILKYSGLHQQRVVTAPWRSLSKRVSEVPAKHAETETKKIWCYSIYYIAS